MLCVFVRLCAHDNQMMKVREEVNFSGFIYPFFEEKVEGLFKDFQFSPFSAKKSLESVFFGSSPTWAILSWRSFCVYSFLPLENLKGWIKLALKFKDFSAPTAIIFQGLSRTFKVCANPDCYNWLIIGSEAPNVNFRKISVWKTIWDLEFSEHYFVVKFLVCLPLLGFSNI